MRRRVCVGAVFSHTFSGGLRDHLGNLIRVECDSSIISVALWSCSTSVITTITTVSARAIYSNLLLEDHCFP